MRISLIVLIALVGLTVAGRVNVGKAAEKIKNLKAKFSKVLRKKNDNDDKTTSTSDLMVSSGQIFGYGRNKDKNSGQVVVKVSKKPIMIDMTPDEQKRKWFDLADEKFPFKKGGFAQWRPTRTGLVFRSADEKSSVVCESSKHSGDNTTAVFRFHCDSPSQNLPRFAESRSYYYWAPTTDGTPYGWSDYWDNFGYSYWSMGPSGYYGCSALTAQSWCPSNYPNCACGSKVAYYPYTNCGDNDCMPWNNNNQYSSYYLPYCNSCNYVAPDYTSGCSECAPSFSSYSLQPRIGA